MIEFVLNRIMNLGRKNVLLLGVRKVSFHIELQNLGCSIRYVVLNNNKYIIFLYIFIYLDIDSLIVPEKKCFIYNYIKLYEIIYNYI